MTPLNHRKWLETIVATGSQRSGFAQDALRELDALGEAAGLLDEIADAVTREKLGDVDIVDTVVDALEKRTAVAALMERAGVIEPGGDVSVDILAMFLPS